MLAGDRPPAARKGRLMNLRVINRLGMLAIGAAVASSPGLAWADSSSDWLSSIDGLLAGPAGCRPRSEPGHQKIDGVLAGEALPAASGLNLAISFDGMSLCRTATRRPPQSGEFGLAIAYGDGACATAEGGTGDYALADGAGAIAAAGGIAGSTGNDFDSAIDIGNNATVRSVQRRLRRPGQACRKCRQTRKR